MNRSGDGMRREEKRGGTGEEGGRGREEMRREKGDERRIK
jgi:hypothetical protein